MEPEMIRKPINPVALVFMLAVLGACSSAYYKAMEG
jgi:hypothetical protein